MKVIQLVMEGIIPAIPLLAEHPTRGRFYTFRHGQAGRGRKLVEIPLAVADFPVKGEGRAEHLASEEFSLVSLGEAFLLQRGRADGCELVLWSLSPGFRGSATYEVAGHAEVLTEGREAQGDAGRMGGAPRPVVLVTGDCELRWERTGRLYGTPPKWRAIRKDGRWTVEPDDATSDAVAAALTSA